VASKEIEETMKKRDLIQEAVKLGNTHNPHYRLENAGWVKIGHGSFKTAYRKGNIVVKVGNCDDDMRVYKYLRRHRIVRDTMVKTYYVSRRVVVQQYHRTLSGREFSDNYHRIPRGKYTVDPIFPEPVREISDLGPNNMCVLPNGRLRIIDAQYFEDR